MKHLKLFESPTHFWRPDISNGDVNTVKDIMNILKDDPLLLVEGKSKKTLERSGFYGKYEVRYNVFKTEECNDKYLIDACKNVYDRLKNEDFRSIVKAVWSDSDHDQVWKDIVDYKPTKYTPVKLVAITIHNLNGGI